MHIIVVDLLFSFFDQVVRTISAAAELINAFRQFISFAGLVTIDLHERLFAWNAWEAS